MNRRSPQALNTEPRRWRAGSVTNNCAKQRSAKTKTKIGYCIETAICGAWEYLGTMRKGSSRKHTSPTFSNT